jgi:hypothetical protein
MRGLAHHLAALGLQAEAAVVAQAADDLVTCRTRLEDTHRALRRAARARPAGPGLDPLFIPAPERVRTSLAQEAADALAAAIDLIGTDR